MHLLRPSHLILFTLCTSALSAQSLVPMPDVVNSNISFAGTVDSFAVSGDTLYIGGNFDTVGGVARNDLAAIDLSNGSVTSWNPGVTGGFGGVTGLGLSSDGSTLYVGGNFTGLGGSARNSLGAVSTATGSATSWNPDLNGGVSALTVNAATGRVFAVGNFTQASGNTVTANRVVGVAADGTVTGYAGSTNFIGSDYRSIGSSTDGSTLYIAHIGDVTWDAAAGGTVTRSDFTALQTSNFLATPFVPSIQESKFSSPGQSLAVHGNSLYIGGQFDNVGGVANVSTGTARDRIVKFDMNATGSDGTLDTTFAPTSAANGPNGGSIRGLVFIGGQLYAIGGFTAYAGTALQGIALLDPTTGALDDSFSVSTSASLFGNNNTFSYGDSTTGDLFISANGIVGATVLGEVQDNYFIGLTTSSAVPEPATWAAIAGVGALGLALVRRRHQPRA